MQAPGRRRPATALLAVVVVLLPACADDEPASDAASAADRDLVAGTDLVPGAVVTVEGAVVENTMDPCLLPDHEEPCIEDLGGVLTVDVDGREVSVHYGGGEWPPCDNPPAISQGEQARVGMRVTVHAEVAADDHASGADLDTCGSSGSVIEVHGP